MRKFENKNARPLPDPESIGRAGQHRKRLKRWEITLGPRFITFSCHGRLPLLGDPADRDEFVRCLEAARERHRFRLVAWVVMPEHAHLIVVPTSGSADPNARGSSLPAVLAGIKKSLSQRVLAGWRARGSPWMERIRDRTGREIFWLAGGGFDRNIRDREELAREIDYIHMNPVERGLVSVPIDWVWSSARWYERIRENTLRIDELIVRRDGAWWTS